MHGSSAATTAERGRVSSSGRQSPLLQQSLLTSACGVSCCTSAAHCSTDCGLEMSTWVTLTFSRPCSSLA